MAAVILGAIISAFSGYLAMTMGWGLEMQSWGWFIGMYLVGIIGGIIATAGLGK